jgi:hypothetical protein
MPKQNRVTPFGDLISSTAKGTLMGNRGCVHSNTGQITKTWARQAWVTCLLEYNGRHRQVMAPGQYTELFFLDEATALAAGHRPCGTCQKSRYESFKSVWIKANSNFIGMPATSINDIDRHLHTERYASNGRSELAQQVLSRLPDGCFVVRQGNRDLAWLYWEGRLYRWTPGGYGAGEIGQPDEVVHVLTPSSIVRTIREGFSPMAHLSATLNYPSEDCPSGKANIEPLKNEQPEAAASTSALSPVDSKKFISGTPATRFHRPDVTPSGKELFAYFAAILRVTGMDQGKTFPLKRFLGNFSGHTNAGRIERHKDGYRLTPSGLDYFRDRYRTGNPQRVHQADVEAYVQRILNGGKGWAAIDE